MDFDKELLAKVKASAFKPQPVQEVKIDRRLLGESKTVLGEEKDPDDYKTGSLFPAMNDEPELQTIHHKAELHVGGSNPQNIHIIGVKTFNREPHETAKEFKSRVFKEVNSGHSSWNESTDAVRQHSAYSPFNDFNDLAREEGTHSATGAPRWMHAAGGDVVHHTIDDGSDGINTTVHHFLRVGHNK